VINIAHSHGIPVLIDGAQAMPHTRVNVRELDCDFYVFSGHKVFGPTGTGVLYGKKELLEAMPPYKVGGDMIKSVTFEKTIYNDLPYKFEAGTPHIIGAIGLSHAIDYLRNTDFDEMVKHECALLDYTTDKLQEIKDILIIGNAEKKSPVISFTMGQIHPHDIGTILDNQGVCIRTGHHCTQPLMERVQIPATARASFAFYNTIEEADALIAGIKKVKEVMG
jgi:cysteine desulfurase/selenocysteine lyase